MPRLSLRIKLLLAVLLVLLPVLVLLVLSNLSELQRAQNGILDRQVSSAQTIAGLVDQTYDDAIDLGLALAADPLINSYDPALADPHLQALAPNYWEYLAIEVFDADGENVGTSRPYAPGQPRENAGQVAEFQQVIATGQAQVVEVHPASRPEFANTPVVGVLVPVMKDGRASGVVHIVFDPTLFPSRLSAVSLPSGSAIQIIDPHGQLGFHTLRPELGWEQRDLSGLPEVQAALAGQVVRTADFHSPFTGEPRILGLVRTPQFGWLVAVSSPTALVFGPIEAAHSRDLVAYGLIALIGIAAAWALSGYLTGPLARLTAMANDLGRGQLGRRTEVRTGDEVEVLARAFNSMAQQLQGTISALAGARAEIQTILDNAPSGIIYVDAETGRVVVNPAAQERLGRAVLPEAGRAQYVERILHVDGRPVALDELPSSRALQGQVVRGEEFTIVRQDGRRIPVLTNAAPVRDAEGKVAGAVMVFEDISRLKRAEEALRQSERRFRAIFDQTFEFIGLLAPDGTLLEANQTSLDFVGTTLEQVVGQPFWETPWWSHSPALQEQLKAAIDEAAQGKLVRMEVEHPGADGMVARVDFSLRPVTDEDGRVVLLIPEGRDITERKRAEEQLAAERARLQTILDRAPGGILVVEASTGHLTLNPRAREHLGGGVGPEAGITQMVGRVLAPDGRALALEELPSSRALQGEVVTGEELQLVRADGGAFPILANAAPIRSPRGSVTGAVVVFEDITALKELQRLREEWTSIIAHDLRQPITVISGYAGLLARLAEQHPAPPQEKTGLEHIGASAQQLNRMIADLLDISRLEAGRLTLERQPVDLPGLVHQVVERADETLAGHSVQVRVAGDVPSVEADPGRMEQVLTNLLSNAARYGYPDTDIVVELARRDAEVELTVTNRGEGIPPDERGKVFSRFHRARGTQAGPVQGLGLGLYITKGLVEAHGGHIWVESIPGQTTTFHFTLPVAQPQAGARNRAA